MNGRAIGEVVSTYISVRPSTVDHLRHLLAVYGCQDYDALISRLSAHLARGLRLTEDGSGLCTSLFIRPDSTAVRCRIRESHTRVSDHADPSVIHRWWNRAGEREEWA